MIRVAGFQWALKLGALAAVITASAAELAACGDSWSGRIIWIGDCEIAVERTDCIPAGRTAVCTKQAFVAVKRTPACLNAQPADR